MNNPFFDLDTFKEAVRMLFRTSHKNCSVCIEQIDVGITSFAEIPNVKASWGRKALTLFISNPFNVSFRIPYNTVIRYEVYNDMVNIELTGRNLVSIRGLK